MTYIGVDIGGTKCAVTLGEGKNIRKKIRFATGEADATVRRLCEAVTEMGAADAVGISCGGPLDEARGRILSPPNLPGFDDVPITDILSRAAGCPAYLLNDANACALAETRYGAGCGAQNTVFLTCGTGFGGGIVLDGRLVRGANGNAGEIGHVRLSPRGPVGYGKHGSAEGFCSGGGIRRLALSRLRTELAAGRTTPYCRGEEDFPAVNAALLAEYARQGEPVARGVYDTCAARLGQTVALLVDLLNPEVIIIGSIFVRAEDLLRPGMERVLVREALPASRAVCRVVPAALGESLGDVAALTVAEEGAALFART